MYAKQDQARRTFGDGDVEPAKCFVHLSETRMHSGDSPRRYDALRSRFSQLGENSPRLLFVPARCLEVCEPERWAGDTCREPAALFVRGARLVELADRLER